MSSAKNPQNGAYPAVPPTLNANGHPYGDAPPYSETHAAAVASTDPDLTPYLGLRARLSQVWLNRWTILILLVLARVLIASQNLDHDIAQAKSEALSACTSVENIGSAMASMPHYLSLGVNEMAADGVTAAVNGLMEMLMLTVTGVEQLILFYINMMTSTYVCLATIAIDGSLEVSIQLMEDVANSINKTVSGVADEIASGVSDFESAFNTFLDGIGDLTGLLGGSDDPPQIDLSSEISALQNITIDPSQFDADLTKLNASLPTFSQVQNFTDSVISFPFEEIKKLINSTMASYTFDKSVFPVAQKQSLTFCSDNDDINSFFDELTNIVHVAKIVFIVVLCILAVLVCVPMAYREIWRWRSMKQRAVLLQKEAYDPLDVLYLANRPYTSTAGIKLASRYQGTKKQIVTRWFVAYATSLPALFVLALGVAGLLSALCQYILLKVVVKEVPKLADEVGSFANTVVDALNNVSAEWATSANAVIKSTNTDINNDVFGWVNTSTTAVNDTLNTFITEMTQGLNDTFGGTILYQPITEVFNCLIGLKVASVEKGLTWVHDNAHITFPEFNNDTFSLGAAASITNSSADDSFLSSPGSVTSDDITNTVVSMAEWLAQQIKEETFIALGLVLIYVLVVLIGGLSALCMLSRRGKTRAEGGAMGYAGHGLTGDGRNGPSPRVAPESRFPEFGGPVSSVHPKTSNEDVWASGAGAVSGEDEKFGHAGHRSVESGYRVGHERQSSYGYMTGGLDEKR